ncbi:MAG: hypothetical protein QXX33_04520 [Candidatus Hadarchaeales archaeon]
MKIRWKVVVTSLVCFLSGSLILLGLLSPWYKAGARTFSGFDLIDNQERKTGLPVLFFTITGTLAIFVSGLLAWLTDVADTKKLLPVGLTLTSVGVICLLILLARGLMLIGQNFIYLLPPVFPNDLFRGFWIFVSGIIVGVAFWIFLQTKIPERFLFSQVSRVSSA